MRRSSAAHRACWNYAAALAVLLVCLIPAHRITAQSNNVMDWDFEAGDLSDWKVVGEVHVVTDSIDPLTDAAMHTVAQGQRSAMIGDAVAWGEAGSQFSSIERVVTVPQVNGTPVLQFSYAVVANDPPGHVESEKPYFQLQLQDLTTNEVLPNSTLRYTSQSTTDADWFLGQPPLEQDFFGQSFSWLSGDRWVFIPWRHEQIDLTGRAGHQLLIRFEVRDCNPRAHASYGYLDNIHLGVAQAAQDLPALAKQPQLAGAPAAPAPIQTASTTVEQYSLWPWCLLLPLLLLGLLAFLFRPRWVQGAPRELLTSPGDGGAARTSDSLSSTSGTVSRQTPSVPQEPWSGGKGTQRD